MNIEQQKAAAFVQRLLANPTLEHLSPLQREDQISQFLQVNGPQLQPTLSSQAFFPGQQLGRIQEILLKALHDISNATLIPWLTNYIDRELDLSFIPFLREQPAGFPEIKKELFSFVAGSLEHHEVRRQMMGGLSILLYGVTDRYVEEIFRRKEYIHFELTKVQRLRMGMEEIKNMIRASILLRPAVYVFTSSDAVTPQDMSAGIIQNQFAEKSTNMLRQRLKLIPEPLIKSAVNSNLSFVDNRFVEATARVASIFSSRGKQYRPGVTVDRGADTPDKSWFNIARRNYKFYGYDIKMLDECYKIAAECGW